MKNWNDVLARHAWWLSGVAIWVAFNVLLIGIAWIVPIDFPGEDFGTALLDTNISFCFVVFVSSLLLFVMLKGNSPQRRVQLLGLGCVGILVWGVALASQWPFQVLENGTGGSPRVFPVNVIQVLFLGLPFVWSFGVVVVALLWEQTFAREESLSSTKPETSSS